MITRATLIQAGGAAVQSVGIPVPPDAFIKDIIVEAERLWDNATSATLVVGDGADDDCWYAAVNLKATDLLAGEALSFAAQGGKAGVNLATATHTLGRSAGRTIVAKVTTVGAGTAGAGETRVLVDYEPICEGTRG